MPDCDDTRRFKSGFTPHLSVGQAGERTELQRMLAILEPQWAPVSFTVDRVSLICRNDAPDDVFRVDRHLPLGSRHST